MKAVVLEIKNNKAALLLADGSMRYVKDLGYEVGSEIQLKDAKTKESNIREIKRHSGRVSRYVAAVAAALVLATVGGGIGVYAAPYGTVSLDVNPSIEYTINRFGRVLKATGVNEDGEMILENMKEKGTDGEIRWSTVENATEAILGEIREENYIDEEENYVVFTVNTKNEEKSQKILDSLEGLTEDTENLTAITATVTKDEIDTAHSYGISPGKYKVISMLGEAGSEDEKTAVERSRDESVNEIMRQYKLLTDKGQDAEPADAPQNIKPEAEGADKEQAPAEDVKPQEGENGKEQGQAPGQNAAPVENGQAVPDAPDDAGTADMAPQGNESDREMQGDMPQGMTQNGPGAMQEENGRMGEQVPGISDGFY